jgi:hypothetical protein
MFGELGMRHDPVDAVLLQALDDLDLLPLRLARLARRGAGSGRAEDGSEDVLAFVEHAGHPAAADDAGHGRVLEAEAVVTAGIVGLAVHGDAEPPAPALECARDQEGLFANC